MESARFEEKRVKTRVLRSVYEDLKVWMTNFEAYFGEDNIPEHERLQIVHSNLEGETG